MPRPYKIEVGAINIILQPHSPQLYIDLIKTVMEFKIPGKLRGLHGGIIGSFGKLKSNKFENAYYGYLYRFINVEPPWLDLSTMETITDNEGNIINLVTNSQKSNSKEIPFILLPNIHRIIIDTKYIMPQTARALFDSMFTNNKIINKFGIVDTNVEASEEGLNEILDIFSIRSIEILIKKPNPEDFGSFQEDLFSEMDEQNMDQYHTILSSKRKRKLAPNRRNKKLMNVATSNGYVKGKGRDENGHAIFKSTEDHPLTVKKYFIGKETPYIDGLATAAKDMQDMIHIKETRE